MVVTIKKIQCKSGGKQKTRYIVKDSKTGNVASVKTKAQAMKIKKSIDAKNRKKK